MEGSGLAKRYADGFLEYAKESIGFERGLEELKTVKNILRDNPGFKEFLESLEITYPEKCAFIEKIFGEILSREMRHFLQLLLKKERIDNFTHIAEYARIKYEHGEAVSALVKSAFPLDLEHLQALKDALEKRIQKKMHLYIDLDPALLGGVKATIGNIVIDGSVRGRLDELREKLMRVRVI